MRRKPRSIIGTLLVCLSISSNVFALQSDRKQPINVEADRASIDKRTGTSSYTGNVVVQQGSMRITADKLIIFTRKGKLQKMQAQGKPVAFTQRVEKGSKGISAQAQNMTYEAATNIITFEQGAILRQGANTFSSNRIIYDLNRDTVDAGKKSGGERVTITIQPATENDAPASGSTRP